MNYRTLGSRLVRLAVATPLLVLPGQALSGPLLDAAIEAERKAAQNDPRGAFDGMHRALAQFSASLPLTVPRVSFVTEKPVGYGAFSARSDSVFKPGEAIITYLEVIGLRWKTLEDGRKQANFSVDLELTDSGGRTLALKKDFGTFAYTGISEITEIYTHLTLEVDGAAPGDYILRYTVNDIVSERATRFEQRFTIAE